MLRHEGHGHRYGCDGHRTRGGACRLFITQGLHLCKAGEQHPGQGGCIAARTPTWRGRGRLVVPVCKVVWNAGVAVRLQAVNPRCCVHGVSRTRS